MKVAEPLVLVQLAKLLSNLTKQLNFKNSLLSVSFFLVINTVYWYTKLLFKQKTSLVLFIFLISFAALFTAISFVIYKIAKEKHKNDEFRRVNGKKFLEKAVLYGLGSTVIVVAVLFIFMRALGFANTIVAFNPTDPLLIAFSVVGLIVGGYFIVTAMKTIKAENERRKIIRLKLNENVEDDGTK